MNEMLCDYRRMMSELGISETKAKELLGRKLSFPAAKVTVSEMDEIINDFVKLGIVSRPVRKAGRPITMKEGFTGDRVTRTITMDTSTKRIIEKYAKTSTISGFIEDAVIMYDRILMTGVNADDAIDLLAKATRLEKQLEVAKNHLNNIAIDVVESSVKDAWACLKEIEECK